MFQKAVSRLNLVPELWKVCTNSCAMILSRTTTHCLRNCFLISLPDFLRIFFTISHMKILLTNQSDQSILHFLHFIPTIPPIFPKKFYIFLLCNSKIFTAKTGTPRYKKAASGERPATGKRIRGPYTTREPPDATSSSSCSCVSLAVQVGNSRSYCQELKFVNSV